MSEHNNGWDFAKRLSDALLKVRPLGGSELFVKRNGQYYADPDYCGGFIERQAKITHELIHRAIRAEKALEQARVAMLRTRAASIAGCEEGYGKPEKWGDELFRSHGDLTASIKTIDGILGDVGTPPHD